MKEKRNCRIVQDLLPNYIEKLTNEETNSYIEEHLKECNECEKVLKNMQQELSTNSLKRDSREINYIKKYSKKLKILNFIIIIILSVALAVMTYFYFQFKNGYFRVSNAYYETITEGIYPDTFYATIEEISDSVGYGVKEIKIKGLNINDKNHREEYYFVVYLDNIGDNIKIKWNKTDINFEQLKVGQTVSISNYGDISESEPNYLTSVRMIVVLDEVI